MSRLSKFTGKSIQFVIEGETFNLYPLTANELNLFDPNLSNKEKVEVGMKVIQKSLRDESPTDEEIKALPVKIFKQLMDKINELNGFDKDEKTGTVKGKIEQIRERIKSAKSKQ